MSILYSALASGLVYSTPVIIAAIGGLYSEKSGVVNIAIEGLMTIGAFTAATTLYFMSNSAFSPWIAILLGGIAGALLSLIHAFASIHMKADQVISGTGINLFAAGITVYLCQIIFNQQRTLAFTAGIPKTTIPFLSEIPVLGPIFFKDTYLTIYLGFIVVAITWYVVKYTRFGLRLKACGENPHAAQSLGINVFKIRYISVIISGFLAGIAGGVMVLTQDIQFTAASIHGMGFIALAALVFGKWNPLGVLGAGVFFGLSQILRIYAVSFPMLAQFPNEFFYAFPYVVTVIVLIFFRGKGTGPKASGVPFDQGARS